MGSRALATFLALGVAAVGLFVIVSAREEKQQAQVNRKTTAQRAEAGPYIAVTKDISKDETVRVLVIPHPMGEFFDTTCVIYTNREVGTATMNCPTAHQGEISVPEPERR